MKESLADLLWSLKGLRQGHLPGLLFYLSNGQDAIALTKAENIGGGSVRTRAAGNWSLRFLCGIALEAAELSSLGLRERLVVQT